MNTLLKRNILIIITTIVILLAGTIAIITFERNRSEDDNQNYINAVIEIEKSNYEFNASMITYDEYKQKTDKYLSDYVTSFYNAGTIVYADDDYAFAITGRHFTEKDLVGLPLAELKKFGEPLKNSLTLSLKQYKYSSLELSNVYEDSTNPNPLMYFKYVFTKFVIKNDKFTINLSKKYTFKKENNKYVLFSIETMELKKDKVLTYANKNVEFDKKINLISNN